MLNRKSCILIFVLLVGLFPVGTYAVDITMPQSLHDFPIAPDADFNPYLKATDGVHILFSYTSTYSLNDLFNMYVQYMKNSKEFSAGDRDGGNIISYYVVGIKGGYGISITIDSNNGSQVTVLISPHEE